MVNRILMFHVSRNLELRTFAHYPLENFISRIFFRFSGRK